MKRLDEILSYLEITGEITASLPTPLAPEAILAVSIMKIIHAGVRAHEAATGKPFDMAQLHPIAPVE